MNRTLKWRKTPRVKSCKRFTVTREKSREEKKYKNFFRGRMTSGSDRRLHKNREVVQRTTLPYPFTNHRQEIIMHYFNGKAYMHRTKPCEKFSKKGKMPNKI